MKSRISLSVASSLICIGHYNVAIAQEVDTQSTEDVINTRELEVITVSAERVTSDAQKTATALSVYNGSELASKGVTSAESLATVDPSVNFTKNNGVPYIAIRGIASTDTTEIGDPSVPVSRDGFFTNRPYALQLGMYDLDRIEVLKGPQGTLNGRNSTGGLLNVFVKRPGFEDGYISAEIGNYSARNAEFGIDWRLTDTIQTRFSGTYRKRDGYRELTGLAEGINAEDENRHSLRGQVLFTPSEDFNAWAMFQHDSIDETGSAYWTTDFTVKSEPEDADTWDGKSPLLYNKLKNDKAQWEFNYSGLPLDGVLTYSGGYEELEYNNAFEAFNPGYPSTRSFLQNQYPETWNHELRFATPIDKEWSAQFGVFLFDEKMSLRDSGIFNIECIASHPLGQACIDRELDNQYGLRFNYQVETNSDAVFAHFGYRPAENVRLTAGARKTWDEKSRTGGNYSYLAALANPFIPAPASENDATGSMKDSQITYHVGVEYDLTDDNFVYGKFDTGYKAGGFNSNAAGVTSYEREEVKTFEIGSKNSLLNNMVRLNFSAFMSTFSNYQANQIVDDFLVVFNTGSADIFGAESELVALVGDNGKLQLSAAYLNTEFDDGISVIEGTSQNPNLREISGNSLPNAPSFSMTGGYSHDFNVKEGILRASIDFKYSSKVYYTVFNDSDTTGDAYTQTNASLSYQPESMEWEASLWIKNITDEMIFARAVRNYNSNVNNFEFAPPRTFGVKVKWNFF